MHIISLQFLYSSQKKSIFEEKGGHLASINSDEESVFLIGQHMERSRGAITVKILERDLQKLQCMLYFQNTTNLYWIDQSPYAFQAWYNPMLSQASHMIIVPKGQNVRMWIAEYNPSNEVLQPDANSNHTCGIIDVGALYQYYWKKNLCTASVALIA